VNTTTVAVVGAYGHTARFVLTQLREHGLTPVAVGRDKGRLLPFADHRVAHVDDPAALDRAFDGVAAVVNCAGPFADTAVPVVEAALRAGAHYLDIAAEQAVALELLEDFDIPAREAGVVVAPSVAFYGGLGDLLATAAMGDWPGADEIRLAIALDSWLPTEGTRRTVTRNAGRHVTYTGGRFVTPPDTSDTIEWTFPAPIGVQQLTDLSTADQVTIAHHLRTSRITAHLNTAPLADLADPSTPPPTPVDDLGRSAQRFHVDVVVRRGEQERTASAAGQDIYAVSGPIVATAVANVLRGGHAGARTAGQLLDLADLPEGHLTR
jgi:hypothetical protein